MVTLIYNAHYDLIVCWIHLKIKRNQMYYLHIAKQSIQGLLEFFYTWPEKK